MRMRCIDSSTNGTTANSPRWYRFNNLGVGPAMSILGGIACLALPVPFIFMKYGLKLRRMSRFAPVDD
jgi:hypothetical protein